ncbi:hypothetical protein BE17_41075 [Sorangium cellulosum]|uniref:Uncharacterized protein n=1 Tax=Sorangium cellulosum TaxID=56 RepID=A0A150SI49_SORCE|nr:hypothetical protein BE17_41075 [Sorangium cellulosum]
MVMRYRWLSVSLSFMMIIIGVIMLAAFLDIPAIDRIIGVMGIATTLMSLVQLGASFMMPDDVRCPKCGEQCRLNVRMSGAPEIRSISDGER